MLGNPPEMIYRRYGKTELQMPVLSCGGMRYQHGWQDHPLDEIPADSQENLEACIHRAIELGINHIETARGYGCSEAQLGLVLPTLPRDEIIVQTKIGPGANADEFLAGFETSMSRLKLDYVDLLSVHGVNNDECVDLTLKKNGALTAMQKLRDQGVARHLGFSTHGPLPLILKVIESDAFEYVNLHWYYFDQFNAAAIDAARERDMGVFIISPSDKGGMLYQPPAKLSALTAPLTPMAFNDLFCLARPDVHTLSIGAARPTDFDAHLDALRYLDDPPSTLEPILKSLADELVRVHGEEWASNWMKGLPPASAVPGDVPLYHVLRLYNIAKAYDMTEYGKFRYNLLGNGDHWFAGNKLDALEWDQLDDCLAGSPVADLIPGKLHEAHEILDGDPLKRLSQSE